MVRSSLRERRYLQLLISPSGNVGLGKESILQLAQHNPARIFLAAREASKAESAICDIKKIAPSANITFLKLDLSSFSSISTAARQFTQESSRLDVLMNNAGIMAVPAATTEDGYEIQFGTNYIGHMLLTKLLLPTLLSTAKEPGSDVRVVNLSSEAHNFAPGEILYDKSKLDAQGTWARYGQSKLANILHARELASRYPSITAVSVHPGLITTGLYGPNKESNVLVRWGMALAGPLIMQDVAHGARNQLWAATGNKEKIVNGAYYTPVGILSHSTGRSGHVQDTKLAKEIWDWTQQELASKGY